MYRCIVDNRVMVAVNGVMYHLDRTVPDQPANSALVAAAPWAFEPAVETASAKPGTKRNTTRTK